ncbi:gas vesicle protein GvpG [Egicoccus sp. AB-alg2]|uniref:gas vesicle protein GvpG n=1 Tax=Egicoccus sp. AB-alg2 TaxID=3242693 RepID=UPI00359E37FC
MLGLVTRLVALPVTAPWWLLQRIVEAAEEDLYDEGRITAELRALAADLEAGRITEQEHAAAEEILLDRLLEARAYRTATQESP